MTGDEAVVNAKHWRRRHRDQMIAKERDQSMSRCLRITKESVSQQQLVNSEATLRPPSQIRIAMVTSSKTIRTADDGRVILRAFCRQCRAT